jgi:hypothetical protein
MKQIDKKIVTFLLLVTLSGSQVFPQPSVYTVSKVSFSSSVFNEIAPTLVKDGIIFCSDRKISSITEATTYNDERLYNIFFAERKDSAGFQSPKLIKSSGSKLIYYGPLCISPDGRTVYFTSSLISGKAAMKKNLNNPRGIFIGDLNGTIISNIRPFEYNSSQSQYSVAHPSISRDGKYLYFASDMPGGQGLSDIWYCELIDGKWGKPVNPGSNVNSSSRENYPYIHPSGRLYFSSDRPGNADFLGGFDVYYTTMVYGGWETPFPLPSPINSKSDDFAFAADDNMQSGYFSRRTGLSDDIWQFKSTIIRKLSCDTLQVNSYTYEFIEENAIRYDTMPVPFKFRWDFGDSSTAEGIRAEHTFKGPGNYIIRLDVVNLVTNQVEANQKTYELEIVDAEQPYITAPDRSYAGQIIKMNADSTNLPGWNIVQYYWNFGDESIELGKEVSKAYQRPGFYNIQLIVTAAPDANGFVREACVSKNINVIRRP